MMNGWKNTTFSQSNALAQFLLAALAAVVVLTTVVLLLRALPLERLRP